MLSLYAGSSLASEAVGYPSPDQRLLYKPLEAPKYRYIFLSPPHPVAPGLLPTLSTEILIIGSGAGGGVAASRLSEKYKTLVLDKGVYAPTGEKSRGQMEAFEELYQNGGFMASESGTISVLAASTFGGGTTINWSASLHTQHFVREEWAKEKGLDWFLSDGYTSSLDTVSMGVNLDLKSRSASVWASRRTSSSKAERMASCFKEVKPSATMLMLFLYVFESDAR